MQKSMLMSPEAIKCKRIAQGHDCLPGEIFLDLSREDLTGKDYLELQKTGKLITIKHRYLGQYEYLQGVVREIIQHRYGFLVRIIPHPHSFWANWPIVKVWVPDEGMGGVLY